MPRYLYFSLITLFFSLTFSACTQPKLNDMNSGIIKFYIPKGLYVKETPGDWIYRNSPIETPFVAKAMDRNLTVYGTIILREDWTYPKASINMITNNEKERIGKWLVFNCYEKSQKLYGKKIEKATFDENDNLLYNKGFFLSENCGMINLNKNQITK